MLFSRFNISVSGKHNNNKPLYLFTVLVSKPETQNGGRKKNQATTYLWSGQSISLYRQQWLRVLFDRSRIADRRLNDLALKELGVNRVKLKRVN